MQIAKDKGIHVVERQITRDELYIADEIFFSGTAVEITPVRSVDKVAIGPGKRGDITKVIQETYLAAVREEAKEYDHWLSRV